MTRGVPGTGGGGGGSRCDVGLGVTLLLNVRTVAPGVTLVGESDSG